MKKLIKQKGLLKRFFGSSHHDHHAEVVKYSSTEPFISNQDTQKDMVAIFGFQDVNDHHHEHHSDPYAHSRNASFFSFERLVFADPYYHSDESEPLMNTPHGYITNDDPLDSRNTYERPFLEYFLLSVIGIILGIMLGNQQTFQIPHPNRLYNSIVTAEQLEDAMRDIRKQNLALENRLKELKGE